MNRVALTGHSRGGEAASVAASLIGRSTAPEVGRGTVADRPAVRAVVSIAPSDGQYAEPGVLRDVDFLVLRAGTTPMREAGSVSASMRGRWSRRRLQGGILGVPGESRPVQHHLGPERPRAVRAGRSSTSRRCSTRRRRRIREDRHRCVPRGEPQRGSRLPRLFQRPMTGREWLPDDIVLVRSIDGRVDPLTLADPSSPATGVTVATEPLRVKRSVLIRSARSSRARASGARSSRWAALVGRRFGDWTARGARGEPGRPGPASVPRERRRARRGRRRARPARRAHDQRRRVGRRPVLALGVLPRRSPPSSRRARSSTALGGLDLSLTPPVERVLQSYAIPLAAFARRNAAFRRGRRPRSA